MEVVASAAPFAWAGYPEVKEGMTICRAGMLRLWYTYTVVVSQVLPLET